ncbi:hypothetical protein [Pendulispora albinea]|uniref:Uncharacterized protein n=1 Tax=Pendulispora albinea TaxID=2741071 RepID=A0ABZ2LSV3_9BACT
MIRSRTPIIVVGVLAASAILFAGGCKQKERTDATSTTYITSETIVRGDVSGAATDPRNEYVRIARSDLDNLDHRIAMLESRVPQAYPAERARLAADLRDARSKLHNLRLRVDAVPAMRLVAWTEEQPHLQVDWDALVERVDTIGARLSDKP